jgi:hypothetical protein
MKAILEFDLPEEQEEFDVANNGWKFKSAIWEIDNKLRSILKYEQDSHTEQELYCYEEIRSFLHNTLKDKNIDLY